MSDKCQCTRGATTPQVCIDRLRNTGKHKSANSFCARCQATLTSTDYEAGECTQCGAVIRHEPERFDSMLAELWEHDQVIEDPDNYWPDEDEE